MDVLQLQSLSKPRNNENLLRILLVDDHIIFRKGVASLIGYQANLSLVGEANNGLEGIQLARQLKPDIVLMDIRMPDMDGFEATQIIKKEMPDIKVIILTVLDGDDQLFTSIQVGADGYLPKCFEPKHLFDTLEQVRKEEKALPDAIATKIVQDFWQTSITANEDSSRKILSTRELEVLKLVARGETNQEIATDLEISENTVKNHVRSILEKLSVRNRIQAAVYAVREGII
ncbi:MAG: response regulator transcription factor [Anaerolineae bacterium]|nr:response regulator transcription factor [Anaerolineae bacterium]